MANALKGIDKIEEAKNVLSYALNRMPNSVQLKAELSMLDLDL